MLEVVFSINGSPIRTLYAHNLGPTNGISDNYLYEWEFHSPFEKENTLITGKATYKRSDGVEGLVNLIIKKVLNVKAKKSKS